MNLPKKLASQSALIFLARIAGAGLVFIAQAAIARFWGQVELGNYLIVMATANLVSAVLPLGFQTIGTYFAAEYRAKAQGRLIWRFALLAYGLIVATAILVALSGLTLLSLIEPSGAVVSQHFAAVMVIAGSSAIMFVDASLLVGIKRPFAGFLADALFRPTLLLAAFVLALAVFDGGIAQMLNVFAFAYAIMMVLHFAFTLWSLRRVPDHGQHVPAFKEVGRWWRFALPWVLIELATDYFFDIDLVVLSTIMPTEDLAIFGVCARIFSLAAFGVAAVYAVTLPEMFEAEAMSDRAGFLKRIGDANVVAAGLSMLLFIGVGLLGPFALLLFGSGFLAGSAPLAVLCLSLFVRSAFGPTSLVLSIYDRPYASLPSVAAGILTLIGANIVLVPAFGLMGASIAALIAITIWSAAQWITAKRLVGLDVSIMPRLMARNAPPVKMASAE